MTAATDLRYTPWTEVAWEVEEVNLQLLQVWRKVENEQVKVGRIYGMNLLSAFVRRTFCLPTNGTDDVVEREIRVLCCCRRLLREG